MVAEFTLEHLRKAYESTQHPARKAVIWEMILDAARDKEKILRVFTENQARSVFEALGPDSDPVSS